MPRAKITPREANPENVHLLKEDSVSLGEHDIMVDGKSVWIGCHKVNKPGIVIEVPRLVFDAFAVWYASGTLPKGKFNKLS